MAVQFLHQRLDLVGSAHECRQLDGQIPGHRSWSAQYGELPGPDLEDPLRRLQTLQLMLTEIDQIKTRRRPAVADDTNACPPCPASITRAARFSVGPK